MSDVTQAGNRAHSQPSSNFSILLVNAFSPALYALIVDQVGWHNALYALLACSIVTWFAIELMSRWYDRARKDRTAG